MGYKILYIEDQATESREKDLASIGFEVNTFEPSSDLSEVLAEITSEISGLVLDYRLTSGQKNACFDAPTIAQTLRSLHSHESNTKTEIPIILMSNEQIITDYYDDFSSQDLFDFTLSKKQFSDDKHRFAQKLNGFIASYQKIKEDDFNVVKFLGLQESEKHLIHVNILIKLQNFKKNVFEYNSLIYDDVIRSVGPLINEDVLSARLGVSKSSKDWVNLLDNMKEAKYSGILSDVCDRWWMSKINTWWDVSVKAGSPLRRLNADERTEIIRQKLKLNDLDPLEKTKYSKSTNFWNICKSSSAPIDPFDCIELVNKDYLAWQEKEYLSFDEALNQIEIYKNFMSPVDIKAVRELANEINSVKK